MIKIGESNERSSPQNGHPSLKGGFIKRSNKEFRSSFIFDGEHMTPRQDVMTAGIGEREERVSPSKSILPIEENKSSFDLNMSDRAKAGKSSNKEESKTYGSPDGVPDDGKGRGREALAESSLGKVSCRERGRSV